MIMIIIMIMIMIIIIIIIIIIYSLNIAPFNIKMIKSALLNLRILYKNILTIKNYKKYQYKLVLK